MSKLSPIEEHNARAALRILRVLRVRYAGWASLAKVLRYETESLAKVGRRNPVTPTLAFRVAKLAEVTMDELLTGRRRDDDFDDEGPN